jgi:hypothetical protein
MMMMGGNIRIHASLFALLFSWVALAGCDEEISDPPVYARPDTTSHDFIWEHTIITELDAHGVLHDICYINDTCIWAVGWIGIGADYVNACRWNGKKWVFEKVIDSIPGYTTQYPHELNLVWGDAPDNIWFSPGTTFIHWDGKGFRTDLGIWEKMKGSVHECWASRPNNIWMGGSNGELVHYNGQYWKRIPNEIPEEWVITGIHGSDDTVLVAATYQFSGRTTWYTIVGETLRLWRSDSLPRGVQALWYDHLNDVYTDGMRSYHWNGERWINLMAPYAGYGHDMAANNRNDIMICGDVCTIRHWNGESWRSWQNWPGIESARFWGIAVHGNEAWVAGSLSSGGRAIIMHGRRTN